jgi:hypothetical protein
MKGIVTFFINIHPSEGQDIATTVELFKMANKELLERINKDSEYVLAIVPTVKEACRIEKVDFDKPFPRSIPMNSKEVEYAEKRREEKAAERAAERALLAKEREIEIKLKEKALREEESEE